jgi:hypothetical protein
VAAGENCQAASTNSTHWEKTVIRAIFYVLAAVLATCSVCHASEIHRVVSGLDANDRSTTLFDNVEPLHAGASGIPSTIFGGPIPIRLDFHSRRIWD